MKTFLLATAALVVLAATPASAASCCGKKGMCMKAGASMSMAGKKGRCCRGMGMTKRQHHH
jgi:hypothetical protein